MQRLVRLLEDSHDLQADTPVTLGPRAGPDATHEVLALHIERLLEGHVWNLDPSVPILQVELVELVCLVRSVNALVVDANLLAVRNVVAYYHLLAADDGHPAHLARVEPAEVDVCEDVVREAHLDVRDIVYAGAHAGASARADRDRVSLQHVHQYGEVVRRQVPEDVDIVLEQAQVEPRRVHVVNLAELAARHDLPQRADGRVVLERMTHHQREAHPLRDVNELLTLRAARRERLLHHHVLAREQSRLRQTVVRPDGRGDYDRLDIRPQHLLEIRSGSHPRILRLYPRQSCRVEVHDPLQISIRHLAEVADQLRPPVTETDEADLCARLARESHHLLPPNSCFDYYAWLPTVHPCRAGRMGSSSAVCADRKRATAY